MGVTDQSVSSHASAQLYSADQDRRACISDSISCAWFMHGGCSCDVSPPAEPVWGGHPGAQIHNLVLIPHSKGAGPQLWRFHILCPSGLICPCPCHLVSSGRRPVWRSTVRAWISGTVAQLRRSGPADDLQLKPAAERSGMYTTHPTASCTAVFELGSTLAAPVPSSRGPGALDQPLGLQHQYDYGLLGGRGRSLLTRAAGSL